MTEDTDSPYNFIPGLDLSEALYKEVVKPILDEHFPNLVYTAARMGTGSDVLGFDTPQSMDHGWGPRLLLLLNDLEFESLHERIDQILRDNLPYEIRGFPTNFTHHEDGSLLMTPIDSGPVNHAVRISTVSEFFTEYFGLIPSEELLIVDWLTIPEQIFRSIVSGSIFHDGLGEVQPIIDLLHYYPHDLWLYLLANQWRRISQEVAVMGRCGQVGDELGSRIVGSRLVRDMMRLCFLMEKQYAPYIKWFGTAFYKLKCAKNLTPIFIQIMDADTWQEREKHMIQAYEYVAKMHNELKITKSFKAKATQFHKRPFMIIDADKYAESILEKIKDEEVRKLPEYLGGIDQYVDSTDILGYTNKFRRFWSMYQ